MARDTAAALNLVYAQKRHLSACQKMCFKKIAPKHIDTLIVFLKEYFQEANLEKSQQMIIKA